MKEYKHKEIEKKWQKKWQEVNLFKTDMTDTSRPKYYTLEMFAYPSGSMHLGHLRNYTIGDAINRYKKMKGFNVFHPMGWDAFGLPAENAAIDNGVHPAIWTNKNIKKMKEQLLPLGISYDWSHELATNDPDYYKWTQYIFTKMYEKGLVYKKKSYVNWCPVCNTVLANEQVIDGKCWRHSSTNVVQKELSQWYFKITHYAEELLNDLEELKGYWPEQVISMQKNWIGKSTGTLVKFIYENRFIEVFTTKLETIYGVTAIVLAPEHPLVNEFILKNKNIEDLIKQMINEDKIQREAEDKEKYGVFTGEYAINPVNGKKIPIWIANYVLIDYGTGAVMSVPGHDERDSNFAKKYSLDVISVLSEDGKMINSDKYTGKDILEAKELILKDLEEKNLAKKTTNYRLHDWLLSRQRYWGTPIPILYDKEGNIKVEKNLPVLLPEDIEFKLGVNPLETSKTFKKVTYNGVEYTRETDTMDTFVDSSWYFLRYLDPKDEKAPIPKIQEHWMSVDTYIGGIEHAVLHLLYSRFIFKVLRDLGFVSNNEPFKQLLTQGMVLSTSYQVPSTKKYLFKEEVYEKDGIFYSKETNEKLITKVEKMSKSKNNGINPQELVEKVGADASRLFALFASPIEKELDWKETGLMGCYRFLNRIYLIISDTLDDLVHVSGSINLSKRNKGDISLQRKLHQTIKKVTESLEDNFKFNTAIASIMELLNEMTSFKQNVLSKHKSSESSKIWKEVVENVIILLSPFVPHISDELSEMIGNTGFNYNKEWPTYIEDLTIEENIKIPVQVNGKLRAVLDLSLDETEQKVLQLAKENENVKKYLEGKEIVKIIFIPNKMLNIVVK